MKGGNSGREMSPAMVAGWWLPGQGKGQDGGRESQEKREGDHYKFLELLTTYHKELISLICTPCDMAGDGSHKGDLAEPHQMGVRHRGRDTHGS